ncbi:MAG: hypothetical protein KTM48_03625 [Wolbachia endosymbiont of Pissodes strobi]|nr:hypothetical protein [Wolbachia endosymbiont of Pissodes strobi]
MEVYFLDNRSGKNLKTKNNANINIHNRHDINDLHATSKPTSARYTDTPPYI